MSDMNYINVNGADWTLRFDTSIELNSTKSLDKALAKISGVLDEKQIKKAIRYAKTASFKAGRELAAKISREEYTARKSKIKKRLISHIDGVALHLNGFPGLNLIHFMARPNTDTAKRPKRGVSVKIKRQGSRYVPKGKQENSSKPFVAKIKKGAPEMAIFVRYGKAKRRHMLYGPSPIQALMPYEHQQEIKKRMEKMFEKRLEHEFYVRVQGIVS